MPAIPVLIAICIALVPSGSDAADEVQLYIDPSQSFVSPGEVFQVDLVAVPPDDSLAVWVVRVYFDPAVIAFDECDPLDAPPGYVFVSACEFDVIGPSQAVVSLGAALNTITAQGLTSAASLATITYEAVGGVGDFSDLDIEVVSLLGPDPGGGELDTVINNGYVEVGAAPPGTPTPSASPPPTPTPSPSPAPMPVGGSVELSTGLAGRSGPHTTEAALLLGVLAGFVGAVALAVSRRMIRT